MMIVEKAKERLDEICRLMHETPRDSKDSTLAIDEIFRLASMLKDEAEQMLVEGNPLGPDDVWLLGAFGLFEKDVEFSKAFQSIARSSVDDHPFLYHIACLFFYQSLRRREPGRYGVEEYRLLTNGIVDAEVIEAILRKAKKYNVLP